MELLDRYVHEVGRHLPEKVRADIEREIHSLLEDSLDDRAAAAGREPDEQMAVDLLKEFGEPQSMAASYHRPRYLVGPALYPTWEMIVKIVLTVLAVLAVIGFALSIARPGLGPNTPAEMGQALARSVGDLINGIFTSLGIITLIFALNERFLTNLATTPKEWDPRKLKPVVVESSRVNIVGTAFDVTFNLLAIVILNFYLDRIGIYNNTNGTWTFIPIFSSIFGAYLPAISALAGLKAALGIWLIQAGSWNQWSRWADILHGAASLVLLAVILRGPSIVVPSAQLLQAWGQTGLDATRAVNIESAMEMGIRISLTIALIVGIVELGKKLYGMLFKPVH